MKIRFSPSSLQKLWHWWFAIPPDLTSRRRRFYAAGAIGTPPGWLTHFFYLFLFHWWDVKPLVIFNVFSVLIWTFIILLWRKRQQNLTYGLISFEVITHSAAAIYYLGWGFGAQYYLIVQLMVGFLLPWPRWANWANTSLNTILFILFYYYAENHLPIATVPIAQLAILNISNILAAFSMCAAIIIYFINLTEQAETALEAEHAKSEALLHNVLPTPIANRLKQDTVTIADAHPHASILFADIAGFTPLSQQISPEKLVNLLNDIFSRFDELVDQYNLEKIKTVGDCYMVASGIPTPRPDHAEALAYLALAMRDTLDDYNRHTHSNLQIRIGLHSGPVVAGVIGKRRFLYDLWGDSVNTASRMESHGIPGQIQITDSTRQLLGDRFTLIERGVVDIKGKGPMPTWFLHAPDHI